MKQLAAWRGARTASLIHNVLPKAEAAACIKPHCWCEINYQISCNGYVYCINCEGRAFNTGKVCGCGS